VTSFPPSLTSGRPAREDIDDGRNIDHSLSRPDIENGDDPLTVRLIGRELTAERILRDGGR
jgi:hypothetical protein